ncbi:MAG TPA: AAA family ATPase [archaeon]|nr:AAA family ATPase [archaeon]
METSSVFKNEKILSYEYLPDMLPHREGQIQMLSMHLNKLADGKRTQNVFIFGGPGIGKTASIKFVFREFENFSGIKTLYINCWEYTTATSVLSKITQEIGYPVSRRGWPKDEIVEKLVETFNKVNKSMVICLDEADQLIYKDSSVLYDLTRMGQQLKEPLMLIFISNDPHIFSDTEPRVKSSLNIDGIEFKQYTINEMKDIIKQRTKNAFFSVEAGVDLLIANTVLNYGSDIRVGLDCLLKAGRVAEEEGSDILKTSHVKQSVINLKRVKQELLKEKITDNERTIMEILEIGKEYVSSELYLEYSKRAKNAVTERMFTNYIDHLEQLKLVNAKRKEGVHGFTRIISKAVQDLK